MDNARNAFVLAVINIKHKNDNNQGTAIKSSRHCLVDPDVLPAAYTLPPIHYQIVP